MTFGPIYIDHIGIATTDIESGSTFWNLIGLHQSAEDEIVADQGVKTRFFSTNEPFQGRASKIELLEPTSASTPVGRFLSKRGPGIQQLCFRVGDLEGLLGHLKSNGVRLIDETPRMGAGGMMIAFVHPASTGGVLVELAQA